LGRRSRWIAAALSSSIVFFIIATRDDVYTATSPVDLPYHVLLRKIYSIGAFAIVGFCIDRALPRIAKDRSRLRIIAIMAGYSACIEVAQRLTGSLEGLRWNAIDVLCGALGGAIAALFPF